MRIASLARVLTLLAIAGVASIASAASFTYTGTFDTFLVPATGVYHIVAFGAQGGSGSVFGPLPGGLGAEIGGDFLLIGGQTVSIAVGGMGESSTPGFGASGGGGGGSFVALLDSPTVPLIIAGGGGARNGNGLDGLAGTSGGSTIGGMGGTDGNGGQAGQDNFGAGGGGGFYTDGGTAAGVGGKSYFNERLEALP